MKEIDYIINDLIELNLSYMPFIKDGGLFIPTEQSFLLQDQIIINLQLPGEKEILRIEGMVVWITPSNALHQVLPGVGVQFVGANAQMIRLKLEARLDKTMEVGGYTLGMTEKK